MIPIIINSSATKAANITPTNPGVLRPTRSFNIAVKSKVFLTQHLYNPNKYKYLHIFCIDHRDRTNVFPPALLADFSLPAVTPVSQLLGYTQIVLNDLNWLPLTKRVTYHIHVLMFKWSCP